MAGFPFSFFLFPLPKRGDLVRNACCNATSSFALPDVGHLFFKFSQPPLSVYLRRCSPRSGSLDEVGSLWLETVERGVLVFGSEVLVSEFITLSLITPYTFTTTDLYFTRHVMLTR